MYRLLTLTTIIEAATGLALMAMPSVVVRLLLGGEISGAGIPPRPRGRLWFYVVRHTEKPGVGKPRD